MPADFNPDVTRSYSANVPKQTTVVQRYYLKGENRDTFVKNVNSSIPYDKNYEDIKISKKSFGETQKTGEKIDLFTITNKNGASVDISNFGATIVSLKVPDKDGKLTDVTQGYNSVTPYETSPVGHAGGTIGPCANKISDGQFVINGKTYKLETNKDGGKTHCHGGSEGFDVKVWTPEILPDGIKFTYIKPDMENGYPGNVKTSVTYKFDNNNDLRIIYEAQSDKDTVVNLTNHTYFNLDGAKNAEENAVYDHIVTLPNSSNYTKNNEIAVPTGEIVSVKGTPLDFKTPQKIGDVINVDFEQMRIGSGFDQNYCIDGYDGKKMINVAKVKSPKTGIVLDVSTNMPGFQFYTANHLGKPAQPEGKDGKRYEKRSSFCVEPQFYPNAVNIKDFEQPVLKAGEKYNREIKYSFSNPVD